MKEYNVTKSLFVVLRNRGKALRNSFLCRQIERATGSQGNRPGWPSPVPCFGDDLGRYSLLTHFVPAQGTHAQKRECDLCMSRSHCNEVRYISFLWLGVQRDRYDAASPHRLRRNSREVRGSAVHV